MEDPQKYLDPVILAKVRSLELQARLVVEKGTGRLVGATFVGTEVAELLHSATVAILGRLDVSTLAHAVPSYPTASEVWLRLLES